MVDSGAKDACINPTRRAQHNVGWMERSAIHQMLLQARNDEFLEVHYNWKAEPNPRSPVRERGSYSRHRCGIDRPILRPRYFQSFGELRW